jgi:DNA-binding transcriptional regulator YiaG
MDQEELVNIRHQLSYSQELFAKALGIGVPCLASYEYGRTSGVPENIMETAKRLLHEVGCTDAKKYEGVPMSEILAKWAEQLDIPYENDVALSKALTVSTATISRWKNNKTRPPLIGKPGRIGEPGKLGLKQLQELVRKFRDK